MHSQIEGDSLTATGNSAAQNKEAVKNSGTLEAFFLEKGGTENCKTITCQRLYKNVWATTKVLKDSVPIDCVRDFTCDARLSRHTAIRFFFSSGKALASL